MQMQYKHVFDQTQKVASYEDLHPSIWLMYYFQSMLGSNESIKQKSINAFKSDFMQDVKTLQADSILRQNPMQVGDMDKLIPWKEIQ
mmetsp:Transcript_32412/g.31703  ORF Transcript_32412/g.31703 Transcript_32412/m.31703 type:complete len:87 (-) Transcript_32412:294-554(-)